MYFAYLLKVGSDLEYRVHTILTRVQNDQCKSHMMISDLAKSWIRGAMWILLISQVGSLLQGAGMSIHLLDEALDGEFFTVKLHFLAIT